MSGYNTQNPPAYSSEAAPAKKTYGAPPNAPESQALLGGSSAPAAANQNAFWRQPDDVGGIEDFNYGVSVWESSPEIKNAFIRKVYSILFVQILATCIVSGVVSSNKSVIGYVQTHSWTFFVPLIGTFVNLLLLFWKRHSHPWNFVLLGSFTFLEAFAIGVGISFYDQIIVLGALLITLGVFLGLTLFTFQSKADFSGLGPFLFSGLLVLVLSGIIMPFFPYSSTADLIYGILGALIFSGYIVYDTYNITKRLSPDEYIMGAISLYLDFINLFLSILRVLNNVNRD